MDFTPHVIAGLFFVGVVLVAYSLRIREKQRLATRLKKVVTTSNEARYRKWRGDSYHAIGGGKAKRPSLAPNCTLCDDAGSIIRGYDGRKISCPGCRSLFIH